MTRVGSVFMNHQSEHAPVLFSERPVRQIADEVLPRGGLIYL